ncbi:MAG TPA: antibiotic biosynthesis monooxygenase [Ktedonobacteraceae bacterium]
MQKKQIVLLNVFDVEPESSEALLTVLRELTEAVQTEPSFVSATFHVSLDQKKVFNYAIYQGIGTADDIRQEVIAALMKPEHQKYMQDCLALAKGNQRTFAVKAFSATNDAITV